MPVPTADTENETPASGWTYSFVAEQPSSTPLDQVAPPVADALGGYPLEPSYETLAPAYDAPPLEAPVAYEPAPAYEPVPTLDACPRTRRAASRRRRPTTRPLGRCADRGAVPGDRRAGAVHRGRGSDRVRARAGHPVVEPAAPAPPRSPRTSCRSTASRAWASPSRRRRSRRTPVAGPRPRSTSTTSTSTTCSCTSSSSGASDLHLTSGARPAIRLNGELTQMEDEPILTPPVIQRVLYAALTQKQREKFEEELELDFAYCVPGPGPVPGQRLPAARRARCGLPHHPLRDQEARGPRRPAVGGELRDRCRAASSSSPGPTGSGKSTTLAALVDLANRTRTRPHHDRRGPDRVPAPAPEVPGQPARGGGGHLVLRQRAQARAAPGPRHHPGRRDA